MIGDILDAKMVFDLALCLQPISKIVALIPTAILEQLVCSVLDLIRQ